MKYYAIVLIIIAGLLLVGFHSMDMSMSLGDKPQAGGGSGSSILLETGDALLLETGDDLLLE